MTKLQVLLADSDEKYLAPLELKFLETYGDQVELNTITDKDYFELFFSSPKEIDVLLIKEGWYNSELDKHRIHRLFLLTEPNQGNKLIDKHTLINKYTSIKRIFSEIIEQSNLINLANNKTEVFMVYSPIGGVGKTTIALGLSSALTKQHKRVLYINIETLQSFYSVMTNKNFCANGFEKHIVTHDEKIMKYFQEATGKELFTYVLPFKQSTSALNIKHEDYLFLIDRIKESGQFEYIIIDTSADFSKEKSMLMSYVDKVLIIAMQDEVSSIKLNSLIRNMDCSDEDKFMFLCNNYISGDENYLEINGLTHQFSVKDYLHKFEYNQNQSKIEFLSNHINFQKLAYMLV